MTVHSLSRAPSKGAPPLSDAQLLEQIGRGDLGALGELYDRHAAGLLAFLRRYSVDDDAEDLVQTVFLRVVNRAHSFDGRSASGRSWLFGIGIRVVQERRRSIRRLASMLGSVATWRLGYTRTPLTTRTDIERAVATLSEPKRAVLLLAEVEGFTCDEIAEMLEVPVGTVWTRLHHARKELRHRFEETP
jgi:RNA polymerase sigma-70 factor (ECF subfamily)